MISARRVGRARHEFRFAGRELVVLGAVFCLILSLVFAVGVVVGRETARAKGGPRGEAVREHRLPDPEGLRGLEAPAKTAAARAEEKVTFYRTLTAPTQDLPQIGKPTIEERLVPKDEAPPSAPPAADVVPEAPRAAAEPPRAAPERRAPKAPEAAPGPRPARAAQAPARPGPAQTATAEADAWTVQVSAFRSRALAENLRARLAARGLDAYVFPSITEDGRPRYRVRVGTYAARSDAERVAADLRSERGLSPLVTPRAR